MPSPKVRWTRSRLVPKAVILMVRKASSVSPFQLVALSFTGVQNQGFGGSITASVQDLFSRRLLDARRQMTGDHLSGVAAAFAGGGRGEHIRNQRRVRLRHAPAREVIGADEADQREENHAPGEQTAFAEHHA